MGAFLKGYGLGMKTAGLKIFRKEQVWKMLRKNLKLKISKRKKIIKLGKSVLVKIYASLTPENGSGYLKRKDVSKRCSLTFAKYYAKILGAYFSLELLEKDSSVRYNTEKLS